MADSFSKRYGFASRSNQIREDAPESVRVGLREVLERIGFERPSSQRRIICQALRVRPDPGNWSDYPNVDQEVDDLIHGLVWFKFYDMCEKLNSLEEVRQKGVMDDYSGTLFAHELNKLFSEENVIYRMDEAGEIHPEGSEQFEEAIHLTLENLSGPIFQPPLELFGKALAFRNALPPDNANAVKEAVNSLEAVLQIIAEKPGVALPQILTNSGLSYDSHVERVMKELYGLGCAIQGGRHAGVGGLIPSAIEADCAIHISSACISYAISKYKE
jgi:hypothetical protein